ncbi:MAG TPA: hypothetical protein VM618_01765, partial [Acidimicrobiia bacterium]|nr:hypothetical protein [Acidimicrobiia bacterium]
LSRRWLVLVPGGVVVHDPLTLADPVLCPRDRLAAVDAGADPDALDLRLGARGGAVTVRLTTAVPFAVMERNRRVANVVETDAVVVAVTRPGTFLATAQRKLRRVTGAV